MTTRDELAALMKDRLREVYMTATGERYGAFIMDDDPLNDVVVDGHVDFIDLATTILARWRLVPVVGYGDPCPDCTHEWGEHAGVCEYGMNRGKPCGCRTKMPA